MGVSAGQRVRIHGTDENGKARSRATWKTLSRSFSMEITHVVDHGDSLELEGCELTASGREKTSGGMGVSRRVILGVGDWTIIGEVSIPTADDFVKLVVGPVWAIEPVAPKPTLAQLAQAAADAHYANACSDDVERSFYNCAAYLESSLAMLQAIAAAYPDVSATRVVEVFTDGADRISDCVERVRDDMAWEITSATIDAIDAAAYAVLMASPVQGPQRDPATILTPQCALFDRALAVGYARQDAGRLAEQAYWVEGGGYGDECSTHPGLRIYHGESECEACIVVRQSEEIGRKAETAVEGPSGIDTLRGLLTLPVWS